MRLLSAQRALLPEGPVDDGAILVDGTRIVAAGPVREVDPGGVAHEHHDGATLLPGLIDAHVHLCFDPALDPVADLTAATDAALLERMRAHGRMLLARGITTVRDLGDRGGLGLGLRAAWAADPAAGPRLLVAGPPITPPRGHCWFLGGETEADGLEARVDALAARGVDWIKVMATGGRITAGGADMWEAQFGPAELARIVDAARAHGLPVAAHAHSTAALRDAARAGVRTVEHCSLLAATGTGLDRDPAAVDALVEHDVWAGWADLNEPEHARRMAGADAEAFLGRTGWLAARGARLLAGTDAGVRPMAPRPRPRPPGRPRAPDPAALLWSATTGAAEALGLATVTGSLRAGLAADALVVSGDPLADLGALTSVEAVLHDGTLI